MVDLRCHIFFMNELCYDTGKERGGFYEYSKSSYF
jgi:hypothetical protein